MARTDGHKEELDELEKQLDEIRRRYDLYFQGSKEQRMPPSSAAAQLAGVLRKTREDAAKNWNTGDRFRLNQIFARYVSLERMWARTSKEIEEGTSRRDKFRVRRARERDAQARSTSSKDAQSTQRGPVDLEALDAVDVELGSFEDDDDDVPAVRPAPRAAAPAPAARPVAPRPAPAAPASPASSSAASSGGDTGGLSEQRMKQLYDVYVQAKKRTGEGSNLSFDGLKQQIAKQVPAIKAKHGCQQVDFKVVLKDGKAMLKAVPK